MNDDVSIFRGNFDTFSGRVHGIDILACAAIEKRGGSAPTWLAHANPDRAREDVSDLYEL